VSALAIRHPSWSLSHWRSPAKIANFSPLGLRITPSARRASPVREWIIECAAGGTPDPVGGNSRPSIIGHPPAIKTARSPMRRAPASIPITGRRMPVRTMPVRHLHKRALDPSLPVRCSIPAKQNAPLSGPRTPALRPAPTREGACFVSSGGSRMDSLGSLNAFVQAAEARSFTIARRQLGVSSSAIGKAVVRIEERLGMRIFPLRSTGHVISAWRTSPFRRRTSVSRSGKWQLPIGNPPRDSSVTADLTN
jgi:hypothetical protein